MAEAAKILPLELVVYSQVPGVVFYCAFLTQETLYYQLLGNARIDMGDPRGSSAAVERCFPGV